MSDIPVINPESVVGTTNISGKQVDVPTSSATSTQDFTMDTQVSTVADLRTKAKVVYDKMVEGIARNIISQMKKRQDRIKEIMREARRDAGIR